MQLKQLVTDDDAVSPVIGVILMVAITVILAAVIGAFVLGIGSNQNTTPTTSFNFDYNDSGGYLIISVQGGQTLNADNANDVQVSASETTVANGSSWLDQESEITAGDRYNLSEGNSPPASGTGGDTGGDDLGGNTVEIIWTAPGGGSSAAIGNTEITS